MIRSHFTTAPRCYLLLAAPSWHRIHDAKAAAVQRHSRCSPSCWRRRRRYVTTSDTYCDSVGRRSSVPCRWHSPRQPPVPPRATRQHCKFVVVRCGNQSGSGPRTSPCLKKVLHTKLSGVPGISNAAFTPAQQVARNLMLVARNKLRVARNKLRWCKRGIRLRWLKCQAENFIILHQNF